MSSHPLNLQEHTGTAAVSVRRQKGSLLRRHWLSAAFVLCLAGVVLYIGGEFFKAETKLANARAARIELEDRLAEARRQNARLKADLSKITEDSYMEVMAKSMGFVYPHETPYQLSGK